MRESEHYRYHRTHKIILWTQLGQPEIYQAEDSLPSSISGQSDDSTIRDVHHEN